MILCVEPALADSCRALPDEGVRYSVRHLLRLLIHGGGWAYHSYNTYSWTKAYYNALLREQKHRFLYLKDWAGQPLVKEWTRKFGILDFDNQDMPDPPLPRQYSFGGWIRGSRMYVMCNFPPVWTRREKPGWWVYRSTHPKGVHYEGIRTV